MTTITGMPCTGMYEICILEIGVPSDFSCSMIFKFIDSEANNEGVPMIAHDGVGMAVSSLALVTMATMVTCTLFTF